MSSLYASRGGPTGDRIPKGFEIGQMQNFTPEQMQLFKSLFAHLGPNSFLSKLAGGDEATFAQMEAPALKQFSGMQGNLASRFSGMGMGARGSSGFQNTMNSAASDFAGQLQSNRQGLQRQALSDLMGMSNQLLNQRPMDRFMMKKPPSFWESLAGSLGQNLGSLPSMFLKMQGLG